jgi:hypothetical protein
MWLRYIGNYYKRHTTFCIIIASGIMGILVDCDHFINYFFPQQDGARFLHGYFAFISIIVLCGVISFIARLYCSSILKKTIDK